MSAYTRFMAKDKQPNDKSANFLGAGALQIFQNSSGSGSAGTFSKRSGNAVSFIHERLEIYRSSAFASLCYVTQKFKRLLYLISSKGNHIGSRTLQAKIGDLDIYTVNLICVYKVHKRINLKSSFM